MNGFSRIIATRAIQGSGVLEEYENLSLDLGFLSGFFVVIDTVL
jgi:hypothetical protein